MPPTTNRRRRRTREEITDLLAEYSASGLSRAAFCHTHQVSLATLARYLQRATPGAGPCATTAAFVAVEMAATPSPGESGLTLRLARGYQLVIQRGFCPDTLQQLLTVLERG